MAKRYEPAVTAPDTEKRVIFAGPAIGFADGVRSVEVPSLLARMRAVAADHEKYEQGGGASELLTEAADALERAYGVRVPIVVDGRTEEEWCQEACRIGAYDHVEVIEGVKGRWIRTFTGERTPEKIEQSVKALKAQAERYDRTHGVDSVDETKGNDHG